MAVDLRVVRYHRIRFPEALLVPGRAAQRDRDRIHRRSRVPRRAVRPAPRRPARIRRSRTSSRRPLHAHDPPRRAGPRPLPVRADPRHRAHRRLADGVDRRDRRGVPRARDHPLRGLPLHRPHRPAAAARPGGGGDRGATPAARGWRIIGVARSGAARIGDARRPPPTTSRRCRRSRCTSTSRSASRSAPTATSSSMRARRRAGRATGSPRSSRRSRPSSTCAPTRSTRAFGPRPPAARNGVLRWWHAVAAAARGHCAASRPRPRTVRDGRRGRGHARGQPRARRARRRRRRRGDAGVTRISLGAQSIDRGELRAAGPPASGPAMWPRPSRRHGPRASAPSAWTCCTTSRTSTRGAWAATLDAALALGPDHLSLYALTLDDPDAEGLDRAVAATTSPTTAGARRWRDRHGPPRTKIGPRPSTTTPSIAWAALAGAATRSATGRGPATRAATTSRTGSAGRTRRSVPGAHAFDGATRRWNAARLDGYVAALTPADGAAPRLPPGGTEAIDRRPPPPSAVILGLRTDRGVPLDAANARRSRTASGGQRKPASST